MSQPVKRLQPRSYSAFRCIGADCEDTCCAGWIVSVDQQTYEAYQRVEDSELGPPLRSLVTINTESASSDNYARIVLSGPECPFLAEGLCSIQKKLGEKYLPVMCATYPRVLNMVDDVLELSLDLSCPEAARLVLLDPRRIEFEEDHEERQPSRMANISALDSVAGAEKPFEHFHRIRSWIVELLSDRRYTLWKRLTILGSFCDQLHESAAAGRVSETAEVLEGYRDAVERGLFDQALGSHRAEAARQLEVVMELIIARIGAEFTPPRFLACYREFIAGVAWTADTSMDDLARRYSARYADSYTAFLSGHEYILENYLINYVHRALFPLGPQESRRTLSASRIRLSIREQGLLLLAHFAIVQTVMIGVAGLYGEKFHEDHAVKVIQSATRTFEHSLAFPPRALEILAGHGLKSCASFAILLLN